MNPRLKAKIEAAAKMASETLQNLDMGQKGATITAAKMQARAEAFRQCIEWAAKEESNA